MISNARRESACRATLRLAAALLVAGLAACSPSAESPAPEAGAAAAESSDLSLELIPEPAPSTAPAASGPITERDVIAKMGALHDALFVNGYIRHGRHDPRWDADAVAFLKAQPRGLMNESTAAFYRGDPGGPTLEARMATAQRAYDAGCRDAAVLYWIGQGLEAMGRTSNAAKLYGEAAAAVANSGYPPLVEFLILDEIVRGSPAKSPAANALAGRYAAALRGALSDKTLLPTHRRAIWNVTADGLADSDNDRADWRAELVERQLGGADPWLAETFLGCAEISRAWVARGSDVGAKVTAAGWRGLSEHLAAARKHFLAAIAADATQPQPYARMITVAMGDGSGEERAWFDKSLARQVDFSGAYANYRYALLPRWGGTHVKILELGVEAMDGGRFDTRVPMTLLDGVDAIEDDMDEPLDDRQKQRVYEPIAKCLDGYIAKSPSAEVRNLARSRRAAWAVRLDDWDAARAQLEAIAKAGASPVEASFAHLGLDVDDCRARALLTGGPHDAALRDAVAEKRPAERARLFAALADAVRSEPEPKDALAWLERQRASAAFNASLAGGAWTPLPLDLSTWRTQRGTWSTNGEALIGHSTVGLNIVSPFELPESFELRGEVAFEPFGPTNTHFVGITPLGAPTLRDSAEVQFNVRTRQGMIAGGGYNRGEFPLGDAGGQPTARFHVRADGDLLCVLNADGSIVASHELKRRGPTRRLEFGGLETTNNVAWVFRKLEVRSGR